MGVIYCLYSKEDGLPRYVGQTDQDVALRYKQHLSSALDKGIVSAVNDWIRSVLRRESIIEYYVIQSDVNPQVLRVYEHYWLQQFSDLVNVNGPKTDVSTKIGYQLIEAIRASLLLPRLR
jgi:hypothetical protein